MLLRQDLNHSDSASGYLYRRRVPCAETTARLYDAAATDWHATGRRTGYVRACTALFTRLRASGWLDGVGEDARILDCGIGTGRFSLAAARACPVRRIHGVDRSTGMLAQAEANLAAAGLTTTLRTKATPVSYPTRTTRSIW